MVLSKRYVQTLKNRQLFVGTFDTLLQCGPPTDYSKTWTTSRKFYQLTQVGKIEAAYIPKDELTPELYVRPVNQLVGCVQLIANSAYLIQACYRHL